MIIRFSRLTMNPHHQVLRENPSLADNFPKYSADDFQKWACCRWIRKDKGFDTEGATISNFIGDLIWKGVDNYTTKSLEAVTCFMRNTFVEGGKCYACNMVRNDIKEIYIDNFIGKNLYGWIYCSDCEPYIMADKSRREKRINSIPSSLHKHINQTNIKFWRISSNSSISPYIVENAKLELEHGNAFDVQTKYNTLCVSINWPTDKISMGMYRDERLMKVVPLANLIFYNRNIFGYSKYNMIERFLSQSKYANDTKWLSKWTGYINAHYVHANGWLEFYKVATRGNIPRDLILNIMGYWGMFNLGDHYITDAAAPANPTN